MPIHWIKLNVVPTETNHYYNKVEDISANCWVQNDDKQSALNNAIFHIQQYEWSVVNVEDKPKIVVIEDFSGEELEQFSKAEEYGIAVLYRAKAREGEALSGVIQLSRPNSFELNNYLSKQRKLQNTGRCLHFNAGNQCNEIIGAHSIQRKGVLSLIADNGHVIAPSKNISDIKHNRGKTVLTLQGIRNFSTFRGFCGTHDNQVFSPIDKGYLEPTKEQVLLYTYRAVCREIFLKECSLELYVDQTLDLPASSELRKTLKLFQQGIEFGLLNLQRHKTVLDQCIATSSFLEMRYVIFCSDVNPVVVFSGAFYPDFDFNGLHLQSLDDHSKELDLLTFSFVRLESGWGGTFLLAFF